MIDTEKCLQTQKKGYSRKGNENVLFHFVLWSNLIGQQYSDLLRWAHAKAVDKVFL